MSIEKMYKLLFSDESSIQSKMVSTKYYTVYTAPLHSLQCTLYTMYRSKC